MENKVTSKLAEFQAKLKAPKGQFNAFGKYKYRSAEDIIEAVKLIINPEGYYLSISDDIVQIGDRYYVRATAMVTNGKDSYTSVAFAREQESRAGMDSSQITGATSSYARKYALNGLFAIDDTKDADATNDHKEKKEEKPLPKLDPKSEKWNKAVEYCASKGIQGILKAYYLSEEDKALMISQAEKIAFDELPPYVSDKLPKQ